MITDFKLFESLLKTIDSKDFFDTRIKWNEKAVKLFDKNFDSDKYYDDDMWEVKEGVVVQIFKTTGYALLIENPRGYVSTTKNEDILLKTTWQEDNLEQFIKDITIIINTNKYNI